MRLTTIVDAWRDLLWKPCPDCGSADWSSDNWHIVAKVVCEECGYKESKWRMHTGRGWGETESNENQNDQVDDPQKFDENKTPERTERTPIQSFGYWTVIWPLRTFYYPTMRFLGKVTGKKELSNRLIQVAEENIERTMETLERDD